MISRPEFQGVSGQEFQDEVTPGSFRTGSFRTGVSGQTKLPRTIKGNQRIDVGTVLAA
jgi:hypothetical protein